MTTGTGDRGGPVIEEHPVPLGRRDRTVDGKRITGVVHRMLDDAPTAQTLCGRRIGQYLGTTTWQGSPSEIGCSACKTGRVRSWRRR